MSLTKSRKHLDVVHHGIVLISDGTGSSRPSRLLLSKDELCIQVIDDGTAEPEDQQREPVLENATRQVVLTRKPGSGLGLSIKGGTENSQQMPIVISKIFPGLPADECGDLFVGDAIIEVNGVSIEGQTHDEVVHMLKTSGDEVVLGVRHYTHITPFLKPAQSLQPDGSSRTLDQLFDSKSSYRTKKSHSELLLAEGKEKWQVDGKDKKWKTLTTLPLAMAYFTRYLWGTDNIRTNSFEVRAVDGKSSGIVHCEDTNALEQWISHINKHILSLNQKSIKMSNKYLHQSEQITYIGWVNEYLNDDDYELTKLRWQPRFLILKGSDVCFFDAPPLNSEDLNKCVYLYKSYDVALKMVPNDNPKKDKRENCFLIETAISSPHHYLSFEASGTYELFESAYNRAVYTTINAMQTRTFACNYEGRPSGVVFDIKQGICLYDIPQKSYLWQYRFRDLQSCADDGKLCVQMAFFDDRSLNSDKIEVKDIECEDVSTVVFNLHSFILAKVVATDPDFLKVNRLVSTDI
ncbi:unnamed protein product [Caenorhabditis auriculariae]|uniref:PDZ domain-containing protein n=1 Tax=Caenorhabditis auriculariae TaxID=2777116 RepID=A0A8S1H045_9PELO|nr:unnamed protein product [Caenorhabditis auriculariae]